MAMVSTWLKKSALPFLLCVLAVLYFPGIAAVSDAGKSKSASSVRIKDLVSIKGVRQNPLFGYGLVIGLSGTGDGGGEITNSSLVRMFKKFGLNPQQEVSAKNVAAVVVTAKLPAFGRLGQKLDVSVSSVAEASSLAGGTLLMTPLKGGDGSVYAVASGAISLGGAIAGGAHTTTGTISGGALIEREMALEFNTKKAIRLNLNQPDFTTAARIQKVINNHLGGRFAVASDAATIDIMIPAHYYRKLVALISIIENFRVNPSSRAKIVINERTGTIVAGGEVLIRQVAISHGNLTVEIGKKGTGTKDAKGSFYHMQQGATLGDLVQALNGLGAKPTDIIAIFQALKGNGAIAGEIELI